MWLVWLVLGFAGGELLWRVGARLGAWALSLEAADTEGR